MNRIQIDNSGFPLFFIVGSHVIFGLTNVPLAGFSHNNSETVELLWGTKILSQIPVRNNFMILKHLK